MAYRNNFDVIITGGSYAGLSAAMALGRALRSVLIIDSGKPCNSQTPHSYNFITHDGETPKAIADKAREQVLAYDTIKFHQGLATKGIKTENGFEITTAANEVFTAKKLLFATGVTDIMPGIAGFADCWGISVLHCPYCHGYEVKHQPTGLIGNGDLGFELSRLISNWSKNLVLFTNGRSTLTAEQTEKITSHHIEIIENEIMSFTHTNGYIQQVVFADGSARNISAVYARPAFQQHCAIPEALGCELTEQGYIKTDDFQRTSVHGVYAAGDSTTMFRAVSAAVAAGGKSGATINKELIEEEF